MIKSRTTSVICFGEMLWDILPNGRMPGGAPLNVAYHLKQMEINSYIISRVGRDDAGRDLLRLIDEWKLDSSYCQVDPHNKTGTVLASMDNDFEVSYDIVFPVAWDYIGWEERYMKAVATSDAFVFGSLIMRNEVSKKTLERLLSAAKYRVFDANLRPPHYNPDQVLSVLKDTDLLKLNQNELKVIGEWAGIKSDNETDRIKFIREKYAIDEILLTKGKNGATYFREDQFYDSPAYDVEVIDTVGSGDAFLAGFLAGRLSEKKRIVDEQLKDAALLGAFVASKSGACPKYDAVELEKFKRQNDKKEKSIKTFNNQINQ